MTSITWTKKTITDIKETIPLVSKLIVDNLKENFNEHGQGMLNNLNGALGISVKLLGQKLIDSYFDGLSEQKLKNFGLGTYFISACNQAESSLQNIDSISLDLTTRKIIIERFEEIFSGIQNSIDESDLVLHFSPIRHPAVSIVRTVCETILFEYINEPNKQSIIDSFTKDFNLNIGSKIESAFGDDYNNHIREVEEKWTKNKEGKLLNDMLDLNRIGFAENEDLKYQETYAYWNKVDDYRNSNNEIKLHNIDTFEDSLVPIDSLIEQYFNRGNDTIEKVLFILADFGKGKSIFLKHKASTLAKRYQQRGEGIIPIYFNLRDFDQYDKGSGFGVISDYLGIKYGIDVQDEFFSKNEFFFLIDSLDECGNLTEERIDKVISSIKKIQTINVKNCRQNQLVITSRPIEHGILKHLNSNDPFVINNDEHRPIYHYISIYGFKKEQFNDSIMDSLRRTSPLISGDYTGISEQIVEAINLGKDFDIYSKLTSSKLLTHTELRRPIFSYMIYKLIINKSDLSLSNKVGIYLSFINVLTKEAKYIDSSLEVNLKDEYKFRNILHATSALWMYESYRGNQGFLKKDNISDTIEGSTINRSDTQKMNIYKDIEDVEFLSQSYFGQNGNVFYFQHQSFAEILLAEYYLKIFIHFALYDSSTVETVRVRLMLGNPTEQTIDFLVGLLTLLKECVSDNPDELTIKKRKLLFPMLASLSTSDYSKGLFSQYLKFKWFDNYPIDKNTVEPPLELLKKWIIDKEVIDKIIKLARDVIYSKANYLLTSVNSNHSSLYNNEVTQVSDSMNSIPPDIDRWLSFLVGNILYTNDKKRVFFTSGITDPKIIFDMFRNWSLFSDTVSPDWGRSLFRGLTLEDNTSDEPILEDRYSRRKVKTYSLTGLSMQEMNFSYSKISDIVFNNCGINNSDFTGSEISNVSFENSDLRRTSFKSVIFKEVNFTYCLLNNSKFNNIRIEDKLYLELCQIAQGILLPNLLSVFLKKSDHGLIDFGGKAYVGSNLYPLKEHSSIYNMFSVIEPFLRLVLKSEENFSSPNEIIDWFIFENQEDKEYFNRLLNRRARRIEILR
ncbi:pentapeptide repeat-containing protein [Paenibacillus sp. FSL E2-0151]|uniref:pentapeptide repeat-containing protein n=1 Tax=Paenibacillus sp. FSL E2-0151 TaxID=2921357 RepID=UPI0030ED713D